MEGGGGGGPMTTCRSSSQGAHSLLIHIAFAIAQRYSISPNSAHMNLRALLGLPLNLVTLLTNRFASPLTPALISSGTTQIRTATTMSIESAKLNGQFQLCIMDPFA